MEGQRGPWEGVAPPSPHSCCEQLMESGNSEGRGFRPARSELGEQMANSSHQTWHLKQKKQYVFGSLIFSSGSQAGDWKV